jgi:hypothetical protein
MKKLPILIFICFAQNMFSQDVFPTTKKNDVLTIDVAPKINSDENPIYNSAGIDVKPDFPGGLEKFFKFVDNNFKYPEGNINLKGKKIYTTFIVEQDGSLTDIKILRDAGHGTGDEAMRVLKKCPNWVPGEHNGKKIRVLYSVPITLK